MRDKIEKDTVVEDRNIQIVDNYEKAVELSEQEKGSVCIIREKANVKYFQYQATDSYDDYLECIHEIFEEYTHDYTTETEHYADLDDLLFICLKLTMEKRYKLHEKACGCDIFAVKGKGKKMKDFVVAYYDKPIVIGKNTFYTAVYNVE